MAVLEGTHGTSFSRAGQIGTNGFSVGRGRGGAGAYFWRKSYYSEHLAVAWHRFRESVGEYAGEANPSCAIIFVELSLSSAEYLNMEAQSVKDGLAVLAEKRKIRDDWDEVAALYDLFITELESVFRTKYKVIELQVSPPPVKFFRVKYRPKVVGWPHCYVVRDISCISKVQVKEV